MKSLKLLAAGLAVACASDPISKHPANAEIQREVREIVKRVRVQTGAMLYDDLKRLVAFDVFAVEQVSVLAEDPNARLRSNAMWVLAQIRDPERKEAMKTIDRTLRRGLKDVDPIVRFEAASGLASRGDWDVLPHLIDGLEDRDSAVRYRCNAQLVSTTSRDFGYSADASVEQRQTAVERWRSFYADWRKSRS